MSSTAYQLTWSQASHPANSAKDFGERHNLHGWALPFRGRPIDPLDFIERLGEYLNDRPPYCQRVTHDVIDGELNPEGKMWWNSDLAEMAMLIHGWWVGGSGSRSRYYCNPHYVHVHSPADSFRSEDDRRRILKKTAALGVVPPSLVAPMIGHRTGGMPAGNAVTKEAHRLDFLWGERREEGWRRMGRTWKTLNDWGYYQQDISRAFGVPQSTISREINRVPDFHSPDDPTPEVADQ